MLDNHAPLRTKRVRNKPSPWLTPNIKKLMYHRDHLKKLAIRNGSTSSYDAYKQARNRVNAAIQKAKHDCVSAEVKNVDKDSGRSWKAINLLLGRKSKKTEINELKLGESVLTDSKQISEAFNDHFSVIGSKVKNSVQPTSVMPESYVKPATSQFEFKSVTVSDVFSLLLGLSVSKASGLDGISARILKDAAAVISEPLCNILNRSLSLGIFPDSWKIAKVFPIHKGNAKNDPCNYRPISVLPILAKVFEKIVFNQLYSYLAVNNILTKFQSGFRSGHSTL